MTGRGHSEAKPPAVEVEVIPEAGATIVKLVGEHDLSTTDRITQVINEARERKVVFDLSDCTFVDSSLPRVLLTAKAVVSAREGVVSVIIPAEAAAARRLAELTRLAELVPVYEARDAALAEEPRP
jgi:anti-anti-sigma factor